MLRVLRWPEPDPKVVPLRDAHDSRSRARRAAQAQHAAKLVDAFANAEQPEMARGQMRRPDAKPQPSSRTVELVKSGSNRSRMSTARAPECFNALVSASRPMRSRWCSSNASRRRAIPRRAPVRRAASDAPSAREVGRAPREIAALERLRSEVHDRPPRFLLAVVQHLPRDVQRLPRTFGRRLRGCRRPLPAAARSRRAPVRACRGARARPGSARSAPPGTAAGARFAAVAHPERRGARAEREDGDHHARVPERPPRRRREDLTSPRRPQKQPERRRRARLVCVDAGDLHDRPGTKLFE